MQYQVIPLTSNPNQSLSVSLTVDGKPLQLILEVRYVEVAGYWILTIRDSSGNLIIDSVPMVCGTYPAANLLEQQRYLAIGSWYIVNVGNSSLDFPDATCLGSDFQLWVGDTPAL